MFGDKKFALTSDSPDLQHIIESNGGKLIEWKDRFQREITPLLVIVTDTVDFESYDQLNTMMVPIVSPQWVHDSISHQKMVPTKPYSPDPRHFLKEVVICPVGLSAGDAEGFKAGAKAAGGDFNEVLTTATTHVICTDLNSDLVATARQSEYCNDVAIVTPEWFDDCMKLGRKVDEAPYLLTEDTRSAPGDATAEQASLLGTYYEESDTTVPQKAIERSVSHALGSTVFADRHFFLGGDLEFSAQMKKHIIYLIEANGGEITQDLKQANTYLGRWRQGDEYIYASKNRYAVGNLLWLYWMAIKQRWDLPTRHLMHYPEVPGGLAEMKGKSISITNYTGEARNYLRQLIISLGGSYSGAMCANTNTHLIAAYGHGPKYEAAKKWGIKIVNHLWLEDSYSKWTVQDENVPRYQYLPKNLDLTTLIGSTPLSTAVLRKFYTNAQTPQLERHLPTRAARDKAQRGVHKSVLKENLFRKQLREGEPAQEVGETTNSKAHKDKEDKDESNKKAGAINGTSSERQKTKSQDQNTNRAPNSDSSAVKKTTNTKDQPSSAPLKGSKPDSNGTATAQSRPTSAPNPPSKRQKLEPIRVLVTSVDNIRNKQKLPKLGIKVVESGKADVLVAPKLLKTQKFLCSLATVDNIVSPGWLEACIKENKVVDQQGFQLENVAELLEKSKALRDQKIKLFSGKKFLISADVRGGPRIVEEIVKAHGGKVVRRDGDQVLYIKGDNEESDSDITLEYLIKAILSMKPLN